MHGKRLVAEKDGGRKDATRRGLAGLLTHVQSCLCITVTNVSVTECGVKTGDSAQATVAVFVCSIAEAHGVGELY